ncbi:MAG: glycoside hydrolase family 3 C-terminal domain-containing protein [Ilumatobacteraceae bacterium]
MPAPSRFYGRHLGQAVRDGIVDASLMSAAVHRMLSVFDRIGALDDEPAAPIAIDRLEHRVLVHRAATESMVLLKNNGVLPLQRSGLQTLAVIGPNAMRARIMGGGSAEVEPHYRITPLEALHARLGDGVTIVHEQGCDIDKTIPPMSAGQLDSGTGVPGFAVQIYRGTEWEGEVFATTVVPNGRVMVLPGVEPEVPRGPMSFRATSRFTPIQSGPHIIAMTELGIARLHVDGVVVFDGIVSPTPRGEAFFGVARQELTAEIQMDAGRASVIDIEFASTGPGWLQGVVLGCKPVPSAGMMDRAVAAAATADAVIVIVGTNNDWETEGHDRHSLDLPGDQAELIEQVSKANPKTVVVVNAGAPVTTAWAAQAPAVLQAWFGGQEMSNALVDIVFGDAEPSGRLATTFPECIEHTPSFGNFPGEHGQIRYGEGVLMGYRWYEARKLSVPFAFGHGLSYTSFEIGVPLAAPTYCPSGDGTISVVVAVTNTGGRRGTEVVQGYVGAVDPQVVRPPKELKAFAKVTLDPGETVAVTLTFDSRSFAYWNPGNVYKGTLSPNAVGVFAATEESDAGWQVDAGLYRISIGRSSDDIAHVVDIDVTP